MTKEQPYPGPGGIKIAWLARVASAGPGVIVLGAGQQARAVCDGLACRGRPAAAPADEDAGQPEAVAALVGFLAGSSMTSPDEVTLLAFDDAAGFMAEALAEELEDLVEGTIQSPVPASDLAGDSGAWDDLMAMFDRDSTNKDTARGSLKNGE